jgi:hypothetical protein
MTIKRQSPGSTAAPAKQQRFVAAKAGVAAFSNICRAGGIPAERDPRAHPGGPGHRAGRTGGRPPKLADIEAAKAMLATPDIAVTRLAQRLGVCSATLCRCISAAGAAQTLGI